jgi:hypothetical protein
VTAAAQLSTGFFARLGRTRIASPGIFGERDPEALFKGMTAGGAGG